MMEKDNTLEDIFQNFNPELNDNDAFMQRLNRKLEAIEYLKQVQESQIRRYRYAVLAAFVMGIIGGGSLFTFMLYHPEAISMFTFKTDLPILSFIVENSYPFLLSFIALLMSFAIISTVNLLQELMNRRAG